MTTGHTGQERALPMRLNGLAGKKSALRLVWAKKVGGLQLSLSIFLRLTVGKPEKPDNRVGGRGATQHNLSIYWQSTYIESFGMNVDQVSEGVKVTPGNCQAHFFNVKFITNVSKFYFYVLLLQRCFI